MKWPIAQRAVADVTVALYKPLFCSFAAARAAALYR
jgi:hypothetical protein